MQYLGNCLNEIKAVYQNCFDGYDVLSKVTNEILGSFAKDEISEANSWFSLKCMKMNWHVDHCNNPYYKGCVISSYPNPTSIFQSDVEIDWEPWYKGYAAENQRLVKSLLNKKLGKVFVPNPGDVYYMDKNVIHKTNNLSIGHPHLCMRISFFNIPDWREKIYWSK